MILAEMSKIHREFVVADKKDRGRLWKIAERIDINGKELNKLAREVVGREFGDVSRLSGFENRKLRVFIRDNEVMLAERYRKIKWETKINYGNI